MGQVAEKEPVDGHDWKTAFQETARERDAWKKRAEDEHAKALENYAVAMKAEAQRDELLAAMKRARFHIMSGVKTDYIDTAIANAEKPHAA